MTLATEFDAPDFDQPVERRGTGSRKWQRYAPDVLPLWVADMDFPVAPAITTALQARLAHPVFGYAQASDILLARIAEELKTAYDWEVEPQAIVMLPGVEPGFNMALKALLAPGSTVAVQLPIYTPLLQAPGHWGHRRLDLRLVSGAAAGQRIDEPAFADAMRSAQAFLLCNPHNPSGIVLTRDELVMIAETCLRHQTLIISDEIHCDLLYDGRRHIPIAALDASVAQQTITLMSAGKTYNLAGLKTAFAIIPNANLRARFEASRLGMVDSVNLFGLVATEAAYAGGKRWKQALLAYLQSNRDYLVNAVATRLPGVRLHRPQGTFLAWLDCTEADLAPSPYAFFLERAKVALNPGADFDPASSGYVRLNFACRRQVLEDALSRMESALYSRARSAGEGGAHEVGA